MPFKLIVGLGNPGALYEGTRHNMGFFVLDHFAKNLGYGLWQYDRSMAAFSLKIPRSDGNLLLLKPNTFMNLSGEAVEKFCRFFKISSKEIIVVCDEISLELGTVKITSRSGTAGHNGVRNILSRIGPGFIRFRVGVGRKKSPEMILSDYVLSHFDGEELELLGQKIPKICDDLQLLLDKGISGTMNGVGEDLCKQDPTGQP